MVRQNWHLDKKVTVAMILSMGSVFIVGILCYANMANEISNNRSGLAEIKAVLDSRAQFGVTYADKFSRLETRVDYDEKAMQEAIFAMNKGLEKISSKIDDLYDGKRK